MLVGGGGGREAEVDAQALWHYVSGPRSRLPGCGLRGSRSCARLQRRCRREVFIGAMFSGWAERGPRAGPTAFGGEAL